MTHHRPAGFAYRRVTRLLVATLGLGVAWSTVAQTIAPQTRYRGMLNGNFGTFNGTATFTGNGSPDLLTSPEGGGRELSGSGTASDIVYACSGSGALAQFAGAKFTSFVHFGSLSLYGTTSVQTTGGIPLCPTHSYFTRRALTDGLLDLGFGDTLRVVSETLPAGTPVSVRVTLNVWSKSTVTLEHVVLVNYPPTGPGFPPTTGQEVQLEVRTEPAIISSNAVGFVVYRASGAYWYGTSLERRINGEATGTIAAEVGGTIVLNAAASMLFGVEANGPGAPPSYGQRFAKQDLSFDSDFTARSLTAGAALRSASGHAYAPRTGDAALLRTYSLPGSAMLLTAPAGAIFQKATILAGGAWQWDDLPEERMLFVPFIDPAGFYRVRVP